MSEAAEKKTTQKKLPKYKALVGINYVSTKDGKERRVEVGDEFDDMADTSARHELEAEHIEEVK